MIDRTYFHPVYLDLYWRMIAERQRIWQRREEGMVPPWTLDPILAREFITNMYRELDPGTVYAVDTILAADVEPVDKLFNLCIYRLMGSRESSHRAIGVVELKTFNSKRARKAWAEMEESPFGEAYRTASYSEQGGGDKVENVALLFKAMKTTLPPVWEAVTEATELRHVYDALNGMQGFGEFLAYQIMVDLLYPAPEEPLIPFTQDDWAMAGPGARKGIWRLMKPGMKPSSLLEVMTWLRDHQEDEFNRLDIQPVWMKDSDGEDVPLSLCNIQSTLCEFFKYARIWDGTLRQSRLYRYAVGLDGTLTEPPLTFDRPANLDEPMRDEGSAILEDPVDTYKENEDTVFGEEVVRTDTIEANAITSMNIVGDVITVQIISSKAIRAVHLEF